MSKIIGVTVGTPTSPSRIERGMRPVKTVNDIAPDENGNVALPMSGDDVPYHNAVYADYTDNWLANEALHIRLDDYLLGLPVGAYYIISHSQEEGGEIFFRHTTRNGVSWREMEHYVYDTGTVVLKRWENENLISSAELATAYYVENALAGFEGGGGSSGGAVSSVNGKTGAVRLSAADVGAFAPEEDGSIVVQKQVKVLNANGNGGGIVMVAEGDPGDMRVHFHDAVSYSSPVRLSNLEEPKSPNDAVTYMFMDKFVQNALQNAGGGGTGGAVSSVNGKTGAVRLSAADVGADATGTAQTVVSSHNTSTNAHNDIRLLIEGLTTRLNALANSTDADLDQMAEIVTYIKSNKNLIDGITTSKVNVSDIINNLTTNASNKPLSAAQGVALKKYIDDALAEFDGGGGSELVVVTVTQASDGTYNADMTASEIYAEWLAGKCIQLRYGSSTYAIVNSTATSCSFVSIKGLDENVFTFSTNGSITHFTYKFARKEDVENIYTPQRGVDYWTEADKAEIKGYVDEAILGGEW